MLTGLPHCLFTVDSGIACMQTLSGASSKQSRVRRFMPFSYSQRSCVGQNLVRDRCNLKIREVPLTFEDNKSSIDEVWRSWSRSVYAVILLGSNAKVPR